MNSQRVLNPEISSTIDISKLEQNLRITGGYLLGLTGYGLGVAALIASGQTAGLSIPVFGSLSAASFAGSRSLMRPAFRNDREYETVREEGGRQRVGRYALFGAGILGLNAGANLITGGLFNSFSSSIGAGLRVASIISGYFAAKYGTRAVRGSFDPKLHTDEPIAPTSQPAGGLSLIQGPLSNSLRRLYSN